MNVLIFVMTLLMLLGAMTYARLNTFLASQTVQVIHEDYMHHIERASVNAKAEEIYDNIHVKTKEKVKEPKEEDKNKPPKGGSRLIGLSLLVNKEERDKNEEDWKQTTILFKNLAKALYKDEPFFKELNETRPDFLDEMLQELAKTIDGMDKSSKPKKAADLGNIKLNDPDLDYALYLMLKGIPKQKPKEKQPDAPKQTEHDVDPDNDAPADPKEKKESAHLPDMGYRSILDYVRLSGKQQIRVYLAPRQVLEAAFPDAATVDAILAERYRLYKLSLKKGSNVKELENEFKANFENMKDPQLDSKILLFTVSKTRPDRNG
jgi:hypothetical protein